MRHLILEYLIKRLLSEEEFTSLNVRSFQGGAHATRTNKFVELLKNKTPLPLKKGESVVVDKVEIVKGGEKMEYDPVNDSEELKQVLPDLKSGDKFYLYSGGDRYSITAVAKTKELGGKGKGGTLGPERAAIANLQKQFEEIGKPITVKFGGTSYDGITGVVNVKENQKADFALTRGDTPAIFISYKPGSSVKDVISYGGLTGTSADNEDVKAFIKAVQDKVSDFEGLGYEFGVPLTDESVALKAIYGSQFGGDYGINNVQALMQGNVRLEKKSDDVYELVSDHTIIAPTIPSGEYAPFLNARYAGDRNQFGVKHARFGVVPMGARKNIKNPLSNVQPTPTP